MIKEFAGMTCEDAVMGTIELLGKYQKTGTLARLMREYYLDPSTDAPMIVNAGGKTILLNPDNFETDVDGYVALFAIFSNMGK